MLKGLLIKESLSDETVLDLIKIENVEIWKSENHSINQPKYWTAISFSTNEKDFISRLSKSIKNKEWYVDLSNDNEKIIVFKDNVIQYRIGDITGKQNAIEFCKKIGIKEAQIDWND